jgi:hypothetical protein
MSTKPQRDVTELTSDFDRILQADLRDGDRDEKLRRKPPVEHSVAESKSITQGYGQR